jgi:hypothetical protein
MKRRRSRQPESASAAVAAAAQWLGAGARRVLTVIAWDDRAGGRNYLIQINR